MAWLNLIVGFLRLKSWALGLIAVVLLGIGVLLQTNSNKQDALKVAALAAGPPEAVDIEAFVKDRDMSELREVALLAQPVWDYTFELTLTGDSTDDHVLMIPLAAAGSTNATKIVGIAYFDADTEAFENITSELLDTGLVGYGDVGPLIAYNGRLGGMGKWDEMTEEAFADYDLNMRDDIVIVWPYAEGRDVALAPNGPDEITMFGLFSKLAGVVGLLALAKLVISGKPKEPDAIDALGAQAATMAQPTEPAKGVPLWKQRSGLVDEAEPIPEPFMMPQLDASPMSKPRAPIGVRKIMIGVIAGVFALLLVSTIAGLIGDTLENDEIASIPTAEERLAQVAAEVIVPSTADPDRPFYEIDVAPIAQWFVAKWVLALAGDKDALMTLLMIAGGVFAFFVMIPIYLNVRRSLRPKLTARIGSMGIN